MFNPLSYHRSGQLLVQGNQSHIHGQQKYFMYKNQVFFRRVRRFTAFNKQAR